MNVKRMFRLVVLGMVAATLLLASIAPCQAQLGVGYSDEGQLDTFSGRGKAITTNISYFVLSGQYRPAKVEFLDLQMKDLGGTLKFYHADNAITVTNALAAGLSNILIQATNTLVAGDVIVIRSFGTSTQGDKYQRAKIHLVSSAGGIIITNQPTATAVTDFALVRGDAIYRMTLAGSTPVAGTGTNNVIYPTSPTANGIWNAQEGRPGLVELDGGATGLALINVISGRYFKP